MDSFADWSGEVIGLTVAACICAIRAYAALGRLRLRSEYVIDWGPRRTLAPSLLATLAVLGLLWAFTALINNASLNEWWY